LTRYRSVAVQVEFEKANFETRISLDRKSVEGRRFRAYGSTGGFNLHRPTAAP
jgi:hypothetical protein